MKQRWYHLGGALLALALLCSLPSTLRAQRSGFTLVIDPGHGGKDPGAMGNGYREKDIALSVALKFGALVKRHYPSVTVRYTRSKDVFVGLQARADFANRHKASLLVSIHLNSVPRGSSASGTETYVLGVSKHAGNLSVAMRENKAMLLEDNREMTYKGFDPTNTESYIIFDLMQEAYINRSIDMANYIERAYKRSGRTSRGVRQAPLWVLSQSAMPSILTEIGFISNKAEAEYLGSSAGQDEVAAALTRAFGQFYSGQEPLDLKAEGDDVSPSDSTSSSPSPDAGATEEGPSAAPERSTGPSSTRGAKHSQGGKIYRIQFMTSANKYEASDAQFKRLQMPVRREPSGQRWVYTVGEEQSLEAAQRLHKRIKKLYPDSFIVGYQGGQRLGRQ